MFRVGHEGNFGLQFGGDPREKNMKKFFILFVLGLTACASPKGADSQIPVSGQEPSMKIEITSPAFKNGEAIPVDHSCDGSGISPALAWTEPPAGTQSFALIVDDPDAPGRTWVHWVLYNVPASSRGLSAGLPTDANLGDGSVQGKTSAGTTGYHGPCPPSGTHRYFFKLYALDTNLSLPSNNDKEALLAAMEGHVLASAELMGTYGR
jgi:Raf kinase inhibitor-like YbhB/YbcL family protein